MGAGCSYVMDGDDGGVFDENQMKKMSALRPRRQHLCKPRVRAAQPPRTLRSR